MSSKKDFRIRNQKQKLPKIDVNLKNSIAEKPKTYQRYGKITDKNTSGTLVSTVIEEHLLKFGQLKTFDKYIYEVAQKSEFDRTHKTRIYKISELKDLLLEVPALHLNQEFQAGQ